MLRVRAERETTGTVLGLCGTLYDITERKAEGSVARNRSAHHRRWKRWPAAGGISHDFNNLLTVILSYAQLIEEAVGVNGVVSADVMELRRASERAGELTRQLLAYSRQQLLKPTTLDLDRVVGDMGTMLRRVIGEDIALTLAPGPRPATVRADPGQIEQVIVNLAVNARDAMPGGGTLTIGPRRRPNSMIRWAICGGRSCPVPMSCCRSRTPVRGWTRKRSAAFSSPSSRPRSSDGHRTGIGHGLWYREAERWLHLGRERAGPRHDIPCLSAAGRPGTMDPVATPRRFTLPRGTETGLIVEDEYTVRALARRVLERAGYTVLDAGTAAQGFAVISTYGNSVDLLLTHIIMPGATGRDLAQLVATSHPSVKILYMSGYDDGELAARLQGLGGALAPDVALLEKPFTPEGLARRVREVLDGREPRS